MPGRFPTSGAPPLPRERVLFVDRDLVVVDKPSGVVSTPDLPDQTDTVFHRVQAFLRQTRAPGPTWRSLKPVHRLDQGTSGVMAFARHEIAQREIKRALRIHDVERAYLALVRGAVEDQRIESILAHDRGDGLRGSVRDPRRGKRAVTHVRCLRRLGPVSLVECRLETGRTHQIRIHLSEAGHPLLGDERYGDPARDPVPCPRLALHATVLGLLHPRMKRPFRFERPLPADLQAVLALLEERGKQGPA